MEKEGISWSWDDGAEADRRENESLVTPRELRLQTGLP